MLRCSCVRLMQCLISLWKVVRPIIPHAAEMFQRGLLYLSIFWALQKTKTISFIVLVQFIGVGNQSCEEILHNAEAWLGSSLPSSAGGGCGSVPFSCIWFLSFSRAFCWEEAVKIHCRGTLLTYGTSLLHLSILCLNTMDVSYSNVDQAIFLLMSKIWYFGIQLHYAHKNIEL